MGGFPTSVEQITPTWLAEVIGSPVESADIEQIGAGIGVMSALYRVQLTGSGCPKTVVVKLPALAEESVFTSTVLRMYLREGAFFAELASQAPVRVPACHHSTVDPEGSQFVLVMEDLGHLRVVDQVKGMQITDAERAVDGLAAWHATWWGRALELAERGVTVSLGDPIYKAVLPMVFAEGWEKLGKELTIPPAIQEVGPRWTAVMPGLLDDLATEPTTMVHGDWRADNLLFEPDGSVAALDFQLIGTGRGTYDLAYFITQSLDRADAAAARAGPLRPLAVGRRGGRRPGRRQQHRLGGLPQGRPVLPRVPRRGVARAWMPATPARSTSPPRCSTGSTGRWRSSTSPSCSEAPGGSDGRWRTLANRNQHRAALNPAAVQPDQSAPPPRAVAQLAEQRSPKPQVGGSSPSCPALSPPQEPPRPWR